MLQSIFVYSLLTLLMWVVSSRSIYDDKQKYAVFAILIYSFIFGIRYGVGADYFGYEEQYLEALNFHSFQREEYWEKGFVLLVKFFAYLGMPLVVFMGFTSFLPLYAAIKPVQDRQITPFVLLAFMLTCYWLNFSNGLRQVLAEGFWLWSLLYIYEKNIYKHYLLVALAIAMHNSAWLLVIFYPIVNYKTGWFDNIKLQLCLLAGAVSLMFIPFLQNYLSQMESVLNYTGYNFYVDYNDEMLKSDNIEIGLGFFINLGRAIVLILLSNKVKEWSDNKIYTLIYDFYIIGLLFSYAFSSSHLIIRENGYFACMSFIVGGYTLAYLFFCERVKYAMILCLFFITTFFAVILKGDQNTASYVFYGQESLYPTKSIMLTN